MSKKMLIDATHPEETRVVVLDGNKVEDFDFESINKRQLAGNIYLAKVTRVEPSLQAAFVEYGGNRHGFLAFSEIHPDYYQIPVADREALLAEEARQAEDANASDDENENDSARRGRSSRGGRRQRRNAGSGSDAVSGLEVIDLTTNEGGDDSEMASGDAPAGLEVADVGGSADTPSSARAPRARSARRKTREPQASAPASADVPAEAAVATKAASTEGQAAEAEKLEGTEAEISAAPASTESTPGTAEDASPEPEQEPSKTAGTGADTNPDGNPTKPNDQPGENGKREAGSADTPPRYMAESAGLGDDERLTEELDSADRKEDGSPDAHIADEDETPTPEAPATEAEFETAITPTEARPATDGPLEPAVPAKAEADGNAETPERVERREAAEAAATESAAKHAEPAPAEHDDATEDALPSAVETETTAQEPAEDAASADEDTAGKAASAETEGADQSAGGTSATDGDQPSRNGRRRPRRRNSDRRSGGDAAGNSDENAESRAGHGRNGSGRSRDTNASDRNGNGNGDSNGNGDEVEHIGADDALEEAAGVRARLSRRYKIQDVIKVRQIMLVQVVKEERGTKGAALTTYLSLAGRYCVLMPNTARGGGISRKITNVSDRKRLREIAGELDVPTGMGLIVRTAGAERTRAEIRRDYEFLLRQWERVRDLTLKSIAPTLIYEEGSLIKRSIRDLYSREIEQVLVEGEAGYREAKEYMRVLMPSHAKNVQPYSDTIPLFSRHQVESYLNGMFNPKVQLKSGGYIVIDTTEALVAIDVNSGRATKQSSIEETALHTNLEAAEEVARQLRLRDLAGLIVIDFIDMDEGRNNRAVEKRLKEKLKSDRARIQIGRISAFGLLEMSRQRLRPGMLEASTRPCPHCHGSGLIRSDDSLALTILREVEEEALRGRTNEINVHAPVEIANYLVNIKRQHIAQIEARTQISVMITADPDLTSPDYEVERCKGERKQPAPAARDVVSASMVAMPAPADAPEEADEADAASEAEPQTEERTDRQGEEDRSRRRRGRRGGRRRRGDSGEARDQQQAGGQQEVGGQEADSAQSSADSREQQKHGDDDSAQNGADEDRGRSRRGRGRRRRGRRNDEQQQSVAQADAGDGDAARREEATSDTGQKPATANAALSDATPAAGTESGDAVTMSSDSSPEAAENADAPDTAQPDDAAPSLELQAGDGSTAAAAQDAEGTPVAAENAGAGGLSQAEGAPAQSAASPADEARGHETAPQRVADKDAPAKVDEPIELHAGDGSTAAAGQDLEAAASGNVETADADAPAETADRQEAADGKGSEDEQGTRRADATESRSAPEPAEEKPPQPKRRGWWSLGL